MPQGLKGSHFEGKIFGIKDPQIVNHLLIQ